MRPVGREFRKFQKSLFGPRNNEQFDTPVATVGPRVSEIRVMGKMPFSALIFVPKGLFEKSLLILSFHVYTDLFWNFEENRYGRLGCALIYLSVYLSIIRTKPFIYRDLIYSLQLLNLMDLILRDCKKIFTERHKQFLNVEKQLKLLNIAGRKTFKIWHFNRKSDNWLVPMLPSLLFRVTSFCSKAPSSVTRYLV